MERILLTFIGNMTFILLWMNAFHVINVMPNNKKLGNLILSIIPTACYLILAVMGTFEDGVPVNEAADVMYIMVFFFGIWTIVCLYAYKMKSTKVETINLCATDYEIVTQSPVVFNGVSLPMQDYSYVNNYIKCNDGRVILLTAHPINEKHVLLMDITPVEKYGPNVYECVKMTIMDNKRSKNEKYLTVMKLWLCINAILGTVLLVPIFDYPHLPYEGGDVFMDAMIKLGTFVLLEIIGSSFSLLSLIYESKAGKIFWKIFGGFIMIAGFSYFFEFIELLI